MIFKSLFLLALLFTSTFSSQDFDSDFDGVFDQYDLCPNSSFDEIVNKHGCNQNRQWLFSSGYLIETEKSSNHSLDNTIFNFSAKIEKNNKFFNISYTHYLDYKYKNSLDSSLNKSYKNMTGDTYISIGELTYLRKLPNSSFKYSFLLKIPTSNKDIGSGNIDLGVQGSFDKEFEKTNFFIDYQYMLVNDNNKYQGESFVDLGFSFYFFEKLVPSISYTYHKTSNEKKDGYSLFLLYKLKEKLYFSTFYDYSKSTSTTYDNLGFMLNLKLN